MCLLSVAALLETSSPTRYFPPSSSELVSNLHQRLYTVFLSLNPPSESIFLSAFVHHSLYSSVQLSPQSCPTPPYLQPHQPSPRHPPPAPQSHPLFPTETPSPYSDSSSRPLFPPSPCPSLPPFRFASHLLFLPSFLLPSIHAAVLLFSDTVCTNSSLLSGDKLAKTLCVVRLFVMRCYRPCHCCMSDARPSIMLRHKSFISPRHPEVCCLASLVKYLIKVSRAAR